MLNLILIKAPIKAFLVTILSWVLHLEKVIVILIIIRWFHISRLLLRRCMQISVNLTVNLFVILLIKLLQPLVLLILKVLLSLKEHLLAILHECTFRLIKFSVLDLNRIYLLFELLVGAIDVSLKPLDLLVVLNLVVSLLSTYMDLFDSSHQNVVVFQQAKVSQLERHFELKGF